MGCEHSSITSLPKQQNQPCSIQKEDILPITSFRELISRIEEQIESNIEIYERFLQTSQLLHIVESLKKRFFDHNSSSQLVGMVIDFLAYCKDSSGCCPSLQTTFSDKFAHELAVRWRKIREPVYFANKSHLRVLSFIVESPQSVRRQYEGCFHQQKMDLSLQAAIKVAQIGIIMSRQHTSSFAFLTNFLWGSCLKLSEDGVPIEQIGKRYEIILDHLCAKYRPAPQIWNKDMEIIKHRNFQHKQLIPKLTIDLQGKQNKDQMLNNFIMERATEAKSNYNQFYKLMLSICEKNGGFHFKSGLKIRDSSQKRALLRIKEKMLKDIYSFQDELKETIGNTKTITNKLNIREIVNQEKSKYEQKMRSVYENMKEPLAFMVSDMLRGKCLFAGVQKINQCCTDIKEALKFEKYKHLKLIEVDNRLGKGTSDIVLKILFGSVIAQMQLAINLSDSDYGFAHKIYELKRSKFFSPLTQLSIMN